MPSYTYDVKNELARIFDDDFGNMNAELSALLKVGAMKIDGRLEFSNSNAAVARKVITLIKKIYPDSRTEIAAVRRKKLRKTMRYVVRIFLTAEMQNFIEELESQKISRRQNHQIAWLRGAFLAGGSVNRPESHYHLEIVSDFENVAEVVKKYFERLEFRVGLYERTEKFIVYMNEADSIYDFLGMVGAERAVERFDVARNIKEVRIQVNRIMNIETANLNKSIDAAQKQLADIRLIKSEKIKVSKILNQAMKIRLENPECTIPELAEKIFITRQGLLYRFKMIHKIAEDIRNKKNFDSAE